MESHRIWEDICSPYKWQKIHIQNKKTTTKQLKNNLRGKWANALNRDFTVEKTQMTNEHAGGGGGGAAEKMLNLINKHGNAN